MRRIADARWRALALALVVAGLVYSGLAYFGLAFSEQFAIGAADERPAAATPAAATPPAGASRATTPPPVHCPAIEFEDGRQSRHPGEPRRPIDLVVVATASQGPETHSYHLRIERTVFGHAPTTEIVCRSFRPLPLGEPRIIGLVSNWHAGLVPYEVKHVQPLDELAAQQALAQARRDWHAAAAGAVFVGRDVTEEEPLTAGMGRESGRRFHVRRVRIVDVLWGESLQAGTVVHVDLVGIPRNSHVRSSLLGDEIYFASRFAAEEGGVPARWEVNYRLPIAEREAVRAALSRRDRHPVLRGGPDGATESYREVLLDGTLEQALELLGSRSDAAVQLGRRRLLFEPEKSLLLVTTRLDARLLEQAAEAAPDAYRQQARLAHLLVDLEQGKTDGEAAKRIARILAAARQGDAAPPPDGVSLAETPYRANRSLRWLIEALDAEAAARSFGVDLVALANTAEQPWRRELRDILSATQIDEFVELQVATERMKGVAPVRTRPAVWHEGNYLLAFSPDGERLLTLGSGVARLWSARNWGFLVEWPVEGAIESTAFTPDGAHVWVAGELDDDGMLRKLDAATGKIVMDLSADRLPIDELALSADGKTLVTASDEEQHLHVWDATTGKLVRMIDLSDGSARVVLRPDGQLLVREMNADSWKWESATPSNASDGVSIPPPPDSKRRGTRLPIRTAVFSPRSDVLYALERTSGDGQAMDDVDNPNAGELAYVVSARRGDGDFAWLPQRSEPLVGNEIRISGNGQRLAVLSPRETQWTFTVLEVPSLRPLSRCQLARPELTGHLESWQLSPDGKVLAVALDGESPALFDTQTGERFAPGAGHAAGIVDLAFLPDGRTLRTFDSEGGVCEWDAKSLRLIRRTARGDEPRPAAHANRDGPFTEDGQKYFRFQLDARGRSLIVWTSDRDNGQQRKVGETRLATVPDGPRGLVPGGQWLHLGTQIYDRQTLRPVSTKSVRGRDVIRLAFSANGQRYAVATQGSRREGEGTSQEDVQVTLHETATGRMLAALPPTSHQVELLVFSPDAKRLIVVRDDNELEAWRLPPP